MFNLKDDPMEKHNVLVSKPDLAEKLREKLNDWLTSVSAKMPVKAAKQERK